MFNIYFGNRLISITSPKEDMQFIDKHVFHCKSKKSFDKIYKNFLSNSKISELLVITADPKKLIKHLKSKYIHIKSAGGVVFNDNNDLLLIRRNNLWDLPKGKIEKNETKKQAAVREVEEECGISKPVIKAKLLKTFHTYVINRKNMFKTTYWYAMRYSGNEILVPQTKEDITDVKWIKMDMIDTIMKDSYKSLHPLFKTIISN